MNWCVDYLAPSRFHYIAPIPLQRPVDGGAAGRKQFCSAFYLAPPSLQHLSSAPRRKREGKKQHTKKKKK